MKKLLILISLVAGTAVANAQNFAANLSTAKSSYSSGKLEDTHFALQQMLAELDITIGKEVLKLLPAKIDTMSAITKDDNVTGNIGFIGATIHRTYGTGTKNASIDIISNSPMVAALNTFLTSPLMNIGNNGNTKVLKVQGYKARLTKEEGSEGSGPSYSFEMPFNNALLTIRATNSSEAEVMNVANAMQLASIAKIIQ